jgi:hypothetical protein
LRRFAADGDERRADDRRTRSASAGRHGRKGAPSPARRGERLEDRRVGVESGRPACNRVDLARSSCDGKVLAGPWAGDPRPAAPAEIEHERLAGEAVRPDAADDVQPSLHDRGAARRPPDRQRWERAPASTGGERPGASSRYARAAVPSEDVEASARRGRHRVVDRGRKIGETTPGVARGRVDVDAGAVGAVAVEAADDRDLASQDRRRDLAAGIGQRSRPLPDGRSGRGRCGQGSCCGESCCQQASSSSRLLRAHSAIVRLGVTLPPGPPRPRSHGTRKLFAVRRRLAPKDI